MEQLDNIVKRNLATVGLANGTKICSACCDEHDPLPEGDTNAERKWRRKHKICRDTPDDLLVSLPFAT